MLSFNYLVGFKEVPNTRFIYETRTVVSGRVQLTRGVAFPPQKVYREMSSLYRRLQHALQYRKMSDRAVDI